MSLPESRTRRLARFCPILLAPYLLLAGGADLAAQDRPPAVEAFIKKYGVIAAAPGSPPPAGVAALAPATPRPESAAGFDDRMAAEYRYGPSIGALATVLRERAAVPPAPPRSARDVQRAIDETFGVSRFGHGFRPTKRERLSSTATGDIELLAFDFGDRARGQALVGRPARPNGVLLVALHGCLTSPDDVLIDASDYPHAFGLRAMERGYTVVAPYVLSACMWMYNLDWLARMSGVSVFGYELAKIAELTRWARQEFKSGRTVIWGISLGGQYTMLSSALTPRLFDVTVISGATTEYEPAYLAEFEANGVDGTAGKRLGTNTQVALSARVARRDVIAAIVPRPIVFEISTGDLAFAPSTASVVDYVDRAAVRRRAPRPEVVLFEGEHGTKPEATLDVIDRLSHARRAPD